VTTAIFSLAEPIFQLIDMLLTGVCPFRGEGETLAQAKHNGWYSFDIVAVSRQAMQLVVGLLQVQSENRYTIDDVLKHEWMQETDASLDRFDLDLAKVNLGDWNNTSAQLLI
jgi:serine/threonine protein kinase